MPVNRAIHLKASWAGVSGASYSAVFGDAQNLGFGAGPYTTPSYTWTAGTAVVFLFSETPDTDFVVTIKGVTATRIGAYSSTGNKGSLWRADILTAGSGVVQVSSATGSIAAIAAAGGVVTTATSAPSSSQCIDMASASEPQGVVTATVPSGGVAAVFAASLFGSAGTAPASWTGATRDIVTEAFVVSGSGSNGAFICGATVSAAGSATPTVSTANGTFSFEGVNGAMAIAAWP
jgi:hypothetical protein